MIEITPSLQIDERDLQIDFVRASGPGGQNVNKVATAAQLRFDMRASSLPEEVQERLTHLAGNRITSEGILLIEAKRFRTQEKNREDAIQRFVELVRKALVKPKARKKTKPTRASKEVRIKEKKRRGEIKKMRQSRSVERD
ncbi:MAG TPA: alternative ribosome rescue aminoacyl-tRNA hydrolase ArfB [Anaerolineales bacterium]|nr:alternative ribosome rescue aminoacyl-tRNA hydrolase ArfB [Anaerolineales bacterium]